MPGRTGLGCRVRCYSAVGARCDRCKPGRTRVEGLGSNAAVRLAPGAADAKQHHRHPHPTRPGVPLGAGPFGIRGVRFGQGGAEINTARLLEGGGEINTAIPREGRKSTRAGFCPPPWHRRRVDFCPAKSCSANSKRQLAWPACLGGPAGWPGLPFFAGLARLSGRSGCPGPAVPARLAGWPGRLAG